jgi:hypothetical protein
MRGPLNVKFHTVLLVSPQHCTSVFINPQVIYYSLSADFFVLKDELSGTRCPTVSACSKRHAAKFEILPGLLVKISHSLSV